jgi:hypothetical protein
MPKYGFGDPKSYLLIEQAVYRLRKDGCVRHGAECFNYYFPQELDDVFLVINDGRNVQKTPWKYVDAAGLQDILLRKIAEGYTFPLHPKWILCDPGWKRIYDAMKASEATHVQNSLNCWYPPDSGIREMIEEVYSKHPNGFTRYSAGAEVEGTTLNNLSEVKETDDIKGTEAMDLAEQELERYQTLQRAKTKLRAVFFLMKLSKGGAFRPLSLSIQERVLIKSTEGCLLPVQHIRVRRSSGGPTSLTELKREHDSGAA